MRSHSEEALQVDAMPPRTTFIYIGGLKTNEFSGLAAVHPKCLADVDYRAAAGLRAHTQLEA